MRANQAVPRLQFAYTRFFDGFFQATLLSPAATIRESDIFLPQPSPQQGCRRLGELRHIRAPQAVDLGPGRYKLRLPSLCQPLISQLQCSVSLPKSFVVPAPVAMIVMFHVEQRPVQETAPDLRPIQQ